MKSLVTTFSLIFVLTSVLSLRAQDVKPLYTISNNVIDVRFTTSYTLKDIAQVKTDLKKENIDISYPLLQFDEKGYLQKISASIDYNDGHSAGFESGILQPGNGPGFHRKFNKVQVLFRGMKKS